MGMSQRKSECKKRRRGTPPGQNATLFPGTIAIFDARYHEAWRDDGSWDWLEIYETHRLEILHVALGRLGSNGGGIFS